jgi:pimeloyl-ACP methyl ester carboxylesterase
MRDGGEVSSGETPQDTLARFERSATRVETPNGDGKMVWHIWGSGPVLALFHGGAGSWRHWIHNIEELSKSYRLLVADLPGLGESVMPPNAEDADAIAAIVAAGIDEIIGTEATYDVAGFSFGSTMAVCVAAQKGARVRSCTMIGSSAVGPAGSMIQLLKVRKLEGQERVEAHRTNLNRLMIADAAKIDSLALVIQEWNTVHSRLNTPALSRSGALMRALDHVHVPLNGIWGEFDAPANPRATERVKILGELRPEADLYLIKGAGHWVAYEAPEQVNEILLKVLARTRPTN